jgi:hypothetical protein
MSKLTREEIRNAISVSEVAKPKKKVIDFFGTKMEIRQPTLGSIAQSRDDQGLGINAIVGSLIANSYVPDTDEQVFDEADAAWLNTLPFGPDLKRVSDTLAELSDVDFLEPSADSKQTAGASESTDSPTNSAVA